MKRFLVMWSACFACSFLAFYLSVQVDLRTSAWLAVTVANWRWYNYFVSNHGLTILYLNHFAWLVVGTAAVAGILTSIVYLLERKWNFH